MLMIFRNSLGGELMADQVGGFGERFKCRRTHAHSPTANGFKPGSALGVNGSLDKYYDPSHLRDWSGRLPGWPDMGRDNAAAPSTAEMKKMPNQEICTHIHSPGSIPAQKELFSILFRHANRICCQNKSAHTETPAISAGLKACTPLPAMHSLAGTARSTRSSNL